MNVSFHTVEQKPGTIVSFTRNLAQKREVDVGFGEDVSFPLLMLACYNKCLCIAVTITRKYDLNLRARKMAQQLKVRTVLPEDLSSLPSSTCDPTFL